MFLIGLLLTLTVVGAPIGIPMMILANSNAKREQFSFGTQHVTESNENNQGHTNTGWTGGYEADVYVPGWQD